MQDSGEFDEAEAAFLRANKPREAIEMYTHQQQWSAALRVAQAHDAASVTAILRQKGDTLVAAEKLADAEAVFTQAHAPERAVRAYRNAGQWEDALRVARHWQPELVAETEAARAAATHGSGASGDGSLAVRLQQARMLERQVLPPCSARACCCRVLQTLCPQPAVTSSRFWQPFTRASADRCPLIRGRTKRLWKRTWPCRPETAWTLSFLLRHGRPVRGSRPSVCRAAQQM